MYRVQANTLKSGETTMKNLRSLVPAVLAAALLVLIFLLWNQHRRLDNQLAKIGSVLQQSGDFKSLTVEHMKPGWNRISGTVSTSNDLARLKQLLASSGISRCAVAVDVSGK